MKNDQNTVCRGSLMRLSTPLWDWLKWGFKFHSTCDRSFWRQSSQPRPLSLVLRIWRPKPQGMMVDLLRSKYHWIMQLVDWLQMYWCVCGLSSFRKSFELDPQFVQTAKHCFSGLSRNCKDQIPGFCRTYYTTATTTTILQLSGFCPGLYKTRLQGLSSIYSVHKYGCMRFKSAHTKSL